MIKILPQRLSREGIPDADRLFQISRQQLLHLLCFPLLQGIAERLKSGSVLRYLLFK